MSKINHEAILKQIYPAQKQFDMLLPRGDPRYQMDLTEYGLRCVGYIGSGLMSTVYHVKDRQGRDYACKVTSLRYTNACALPPAEIARRTLDEIRLTKRLMQNGVHGIMPLLRFLPSESQISDYIRQSEKMPRQRIPADWRILELMPLGLPYTSFMEDYLFQSGRRLSEAEWAALMLDLIQPIKFMHSKANIIHRDIKTANIMLIMLPNGQIRAAISDFNVSKSFAGQRDYDYTKVGTDGYAHPRIAERPTHLGVCLSDAEKGDMYATAQIGYQILNAGVIAPNRGYIPAPKNSPSVRVTALLREILNENIQAIPSCDTVIAKLREIIGERAESVPVGMQRAALQKRGCARPAHSYQAKKPQPPHQKRQYHPSKVDTTDVINQLLYYFPDK